MSTFSRNEYYAVVLGSLLHDIGKFYQRGVGRDKGNHQQLGNEFFEKYLAEVLSALFSEKEKELIRTAINSHHENSEFITTADYFSAGMERINLDDEEYGDPIKEALQSVFEKVTLGNNDKNVKEYTYSLNALSLQKEEIFPKRGRKLNKEEYKNLWDAFIKEIENIPLFNLSSFLNAFYGLLQKYTWCIPSAVYKHEPDISLFDHLKTTAAIAGCLYHNKKFGEESEKEFLLVGGDISGIQNFIYRIAKAQGMGGISKRLRGRSFYLFLLQEVIARYIINNVGLFTTNILFCGGGRFELLLPNTKAAVNFLNTAKDEINKHLFDKYGGEIGIVIEWVEVGRHELGDYGALLEELDEKISLAKKRKFNNLLEDSSFWQEKDESNIRICKVCNNRKANDDRNPCNLCELHKKIGEKLPKTRYLVYTISKIEDIKDRELLIEIDCENFGAVYLLPQVEINDAWLKSEKVLDIQKINDLNNLKTGFHFVGNTAPVAKERFSISKEIEDEDKRVEKDNVLSFEILANASIGDKRIGILKMDVDYLGLIFAIGLEGKQKSISRITSLSRLMNVFFTGYLNKICDEVFNEWRNDKNNEWEHKDKVNQIFYTVYSGGDDLVIVGPWSEIPKLAKRINEEFKEYTCDNSDINISAGIFICKPKYPISIAARLAGDQLEKSKSEGRKRITLFSDTVLWKDNERGFDKLLEFGELLYNYIQDGKLPRGFIHGLLRKHKQFRGGEDFMYIPILLYQIIRNIQKKEVRDEISEKVIRDFKEMIIPASYALLKSRKEV